MNIYITCDWISESQTASARKLRSPASRSIQFMKFISEKLNASRSQSLIVSKTILFQKNRNVFIYLIVLKKGEMIFQLIFILQHILEELTIMWKS